MKSEPHLARDASHCRNCGATATGHFCSVCGQETRAHVPSAGEFLHEFIGHYIALEGKLWKSLALLVFRPGRLTADYIAGKRARYVLPLRLYLTMSILFFALLKYGAGHIDTIQFNDPKPTAEAARARDEVAGALKDELAKAQADQAKETAADKATETAADQAKDANKKDAASAEAGPLRAAKAQTKLDTLYPKWGARLHTFMEQPGTGKAKVLEGAFYSYGPYAMFVLLPLFALYLKVLYLGSGRRYGEHLLFALHSNAFAFLMFGALMLAPWTALKLALLAWLVFYLPMAMRRVYGGGRWATALRWMVLMLVHLTSMALAILSVLFLGVVS